MPRASLTNARGPTGPEPVSSADALLATEPSETRTSFHEGRYHGRAFGRSRSAFPAAPGVRHGTVLVWSRELARAPAEGEGRVDWDSTGHPATQA